MTKSSRPIGILVVDDFAPFRKFVRSQIQERPTFHIISEVPDGLEAVQRAEELHPDLVLLDIGLPSLNGVEVARRLCDVTPESKIIFVSQENSPTLVRETFRLGACGYVHKMDALELLTAIDTVLRGERFVSSSLVDYDLAEAADD
jgi:DNA-binding NarL/FixJ family response regulator